MRLKLLWENFTNFFRKYKRYRARFNKIEQDCIARMANEIRENEDREALEYLKSIAMNK